VSIVGIVVNVRPIVCPPAVVPEVVVAELNPVLCNVKMVESNHSFRNMMVYVEFSDTSS